MTDFDYATVIMSGLGVGLTVGLWMGFMGRTLKYCKHLFNYFMG